MKVLVVGPDREDPGGVANYYNAVFPRLSNPSIETQYLEIGSTKSGGGLTNAITDQFRFWKAVSSFSPDIIHLNPSLDFRSFIRDGLFIFLSKLRSRKVLVFFRGWQKPFEQRIKGLLKFFFSVTYKRADSFIVLAQDFGNSLKRWGVKAPISLGTTTVNDDLLTEFSIEEKVKAVGSPGTVRLLYLARLEREKGVLELLAAVTMLLEQGLDISLTIAGTGPVADELSAQIALLGEHKSAVSLIGYVRGEQKFDVFNSHHIFCFPTQYGEGMPNSVLEAMAFGMPIVTCPVGGIADFFEEGKMGALLESNAANTIADSISALLQDRSTLMSIAKYNYAYAQERFLASTVADFLRARYADLSLIH